MRTLRLKALAKLQRFPDLFDPDALHRARTLFEFDDCVTAPVHGFDSAHDYYSRSSSLQFLSSIQVPTLLLSSSDDPFLPPQVFDDVAMLARKNPSLLAELWPKGGHVGFVSGASPADTHYYHEERVIEFLGLQADLVSAVPTP
jgi:predicted alpha/beta-fold hydrolase